MKLISQPHIGGKTVRVVHIEYGHRKRYFTVIELKAEHVESVHVNPKELLMFLMLHGQVLMV